MKIIRDIDSGSQLSKVKQKALNDQISVKNLEDVLEVMEMRGEIQIFGEVLLHRKQKLLAAPCYECRLQDVCHPGGSISP